MSQNKKQILVLLCILGTVFFIWRNSALPPAESSEESDAVLELLQRMFGTESAFARFLHTYVRKIAHFTEYGVLGIFVSLYHMCRSAGQYDLRFSLFFGLCIASVDETLQLFVGRGNSAADILLDLAGFAVGFFLIYLCASHRSFQSRKGENHVSL